MPVKFSIGCGYLPPPTAFEQIDGFDSCYVNFVITELFCIKTYENVYAPCVCDSSGNCKGVSFDTPKLTTSPSLPCNGLPIPFPSTGSPFSSVSGSCTYEKAVSKLSYSYESAGISLTKSNMLIAASLALCAVIGSFN